MLPDLFREVVKSVETLSAAKTLTDRLWAEFTRDVLNTHPDSALLIVSTDDGPKLYRIVNRNLEYIHPALIATLDATGFTGMGSTDQTVGVDNNNESEMDNGDLREATELSKEAPSGIA